MIENQMVKLKEVMRRWPSGVAILTSGKKKVRHGMTVSSFTSISVQPPLITVTMNNATRTKHLVDETELFAINFLDEGQQALADRFAGRMSENEDRFLGMAVLSGAESIPLLADAAAWIECRVVHRYAMPESTLYVGEVISARNSENKPPLLYFNRDYYRICK